MHQIPLSQGMVALVDDEDFERLRHRVWSFHPLGYAVRQSAAGFRPRFVYMHREVLRAPPAWEVDHKNGDGLDNRRDNLRLVEHAQNCRNMRTRPHSSRFRGVSFNGKSGKWEAAIMADYRKFHLGSFDSEEEAALAYDDA